MIHREREGAFLPADINRVSLYRTGRNIPNLNHCVERVTLKGLTPIKRKADKHEWNGDRRGLFFSFRADESFFLKLFLLLSEPFVIVGILDPIDLPYGEIIGRDASRPMISP